MTKKQNAAFAAGTDIATTTVADVMRDVARDLMDAWEGGHRSAAIDLSDIHELLLTIADRLDPR